MNKNTKQHNITLTASYEICAAHRLTRPEWDDAKNREVFGKCSDVHGHQYKLEVVVEGTILDETGMLINSFDLDRIVEEVVLRQLDHQYLNEKISFFKEHPPTAEWIAVWVFEELKESLPSECHLKKVRIFETPSLYAEYSG